MPRSSVSPALLTAGLLLAACSPESAPPTAPFAATANTLATPTLSANAWGPETPHFNIQVILRGANGGFGHVKFRQPNDNVLVVHLDTWVRNLKPNMSYLLQRAVDTNVNDICTSTTWLTLGKGAVAQAILTDAQGTGREDLFRTLASPLGTTFDIYFRVIEAATGAVALTSECYQFSLSQ